MPYARLGATVDCSDPVQAIANAECGPASPGGGGIDWTQVITTGETVIGQALNPNTIFPTRYPTYTPVSSAFAGVGSNLLPVLVIGGLIFFAMRRR